MRHRLPDTVSVDLNIPLGNQPVTSGTRIPLWTIATAHYRGDARGAVWQIQHANHLATSSIRPGEVLVLP